MLAKWPASYISTTVDADSPKEIGIHGEHECGFKGCVPFADNGEARCPKCEVLIAWAREDVWLQ